METLFSTELCCEPRDALKKKLHLKKFKIINQRNFEPFQGESLFLFDFTILRNINSPFHPSHNHTPTSLPQSYYQKKHFLMVVYIDA